MITFNSDILEERNNEIFGSLPLWKTHVLSIQKSDCDVPEVESLNILVNIKTRDEFAQWLKQFEDLSKATYTIRATTPASGKYVIFKQRLVCQHNTRTEKVHDPTVARKTKNTNCPSKIKVTIHAVHSRYKGKNKEKWQLCKEMPCEIDVVVQHNHSVGTAASLRYRKPSSEVREKLISLFNKGHSPASALDCIKMEILLNCPDYPLVLADRSRCPDYNFCYSLYTKVFKKKCGPMDINKEGKRFLQQRLEEYNSEAGTVVAKMVVQEDDYVICQEEMADTVDKKSIDDENKEMLDEIQVRLAAFTKQSPEEMGQGLKSLLEKLRKIKTPSACASYLANFAKGKSQIKRGNYIAVQPTVIGRRKKNLVGRRSRPGGKLRSFLKQNRGNTETTEICNMELSFLTEPHSEDPVYTINLDEICDYVEV